MTRKPKEVLTRAERHLIRPSSPWFSMLSDFCYLAKNLYNHANYLVRSRFIKNGQWMRYEELDKVLKNDAIPITKLCRQRNLLNRFLDC